MARNKFIAFLVLITLFISACNRHQGALVKDIPKPEGSIPVTVIDFSELDGCKYLLEMEDGTKLEPVNLDEAYMIDGLKLYITFKYHDGMSVCMAGRMIQINSVTKATSP